MSDDQRPKPFALDPSRTAFRMRDLDNVQPRPAPPRGIQLDHPRLAPPGMSGIKTSQRLGLAPQPPKEPPRLPGEAGHTSRVLKSLAPTPSKSQGPEG